MNNFLHPSCKNLCLLYDCVCSY